jgi:hypothetical protein
MKTDLNDYLISIEHALERPDSVIPWDFKQTDINTILRTYSSLSIPPTPDYPICALPRCNEPSDASGFCSPLHATQYKEIRNSPIRVRVIGHCWTNPTASMKEFGMGCKDTFSYTWNRIQLVDSEPFDYTVVINRPPYNIEVDKTKTIIFHMEPNMEKSPHIWGEEWSNPQGYLRVFKHSTDYNNLQWHLNRTYSELMNELQQPIPTKEDKVSIVISGKYSDIGHTLRWNLAHDLSETDIPVAFYGANNRFKLPNHMGPLPHLTKDIGMYPYKYHIAIENHENYNYTTEKLVDGILSECLTFYWGAPNVRSLINPNAYVHLTTSNPREIIETIRTAIKEDWWSQRIHHIREEKKRIINELAFMPRLEKFLLSIEE